MRKARRALIFTIGLAFFLSACMTHPLNIDPAISGALAEPSEVAGQESPAPEPEDSSTQHEEGGRETQMPEQPGDTWWPADESTLEPTPGSTLEPTSEPTPEPTPEASEQPPEPDATLAENVFDALYGDVEVETEAYLISSGEPGGALTLAVPVAYMLGGDIYRSNANSLGEVTPYHPDRIAEDYDQAITSVLQDLRVAVSGEQAGEFPLVTSEALVQEATVLADGVNHGYAVFTNLPILESAAPGRYTIKLEVSWIDTQGGARSKTLDVPVQVAQTEIGQNSIEVTGPPGIPAPHGDGRIVFTFAELKTAIQTDRYKTVYLGHCDATPAEPGETRNDGVITFDIGGIEVRNDVVIVGVDPRNGKRVKLIDYASGELYTIHAMQAGIRMTLRDVDVEGRNMSGILCGSGYANVGLEFINVNYSGVQMAYAYGSGSWASFEGCNIRIWNANGNAQEVAEAAEIHLYGNNTINREGYVSTYYYSVFWLKAAPHRLTVHEGATISVTTNNYFIFDDSASAQVTIEGALDLYTNEAYGSMIYQDHTIKNLEVKRGGALRITDQRGDDPTIEISGTLKVSGVLDIATASASRACISFTLSCSAVFDDPEYVSMRNSNGRIMVATLDGSAATRPKVEIKTQALNRWPTPPEGVTKYVWNNRDMAAFSVSVQLRNTQDTVWSGVSGLADGRGAAMGADALDVGTLNLNRSARILFGRYALSVDDAAAWDASVTGSAPVGAVQTIFEHEYDEAKPDKRGTLIQSAQGIHAGSNGRYTTPAEGWAPIAAAGQSRIYAQSIRNDLEAHTYVDVLEVCRLYAVPDILRFGTHEISASARTIRRVDPDWTIHVLDTRKNAPDPWHIQVSATPFVNETNPADVLDGSLVFLEGGSEQPLSAAPVRIATRPDSAEPGIIGQSWGDTEGPLLRLNPLAGNADAIYASTLLWTLYVGP